MVVDMFHLGKARIRCLDKAECVIVYLMITD